MDRVERKQRDIFATLDLSAQGFRDGAVIRKVCDTDPLAPEQQLEHLTEIRRATLAVRSEVARFPGVLELLLEHEFGEGDFSDREGMMRVLQETRALWARRDDSDTWRTEYDAQINRNAELALRAFDEMYDLSERPYADVMVIENRVRQLCRGVRSAELVSSATESASMRMGYENLALRPYPDVRLAADRIREIDEGIEPRRKVMVESNLRLVARVVSNFKSRVGSGGIDAAGALDLFQEGTFGLMAAIDRFRPELGFRFSTYAVHWIKQAIGKSLGDDEVIAVPHQAKALLTRERRLREELTRETGVVPHADEVLERMNLSPREFRLWIRAKGAVVERSAFQIDGEDVDILDLVPDLSTGDQRLAEAAEAQERVIRAVRRLFEGKVLAVVLGRCTSGSFARVDGTMRSLAEVGDEFGLTRQRISQIERAGMQLLADFFIVESTPKAARANALDRLGLPQVQQVVDRLFAERYEAVYTKPEQARALTLCATTIVVTKVGRGEWDDFARASGLTALRAFMVRDRILDGDLDFRVAANRAVAAGLAPRGFSAAQAEKVFFTAMRILSSGARDEFRRQWAKL